MKKRADGTTRMGVGALRTAKVLAALLVLCLGASSAIAAGFRLPEAGAKAMGMGFAFTAQADDPSAIYFNPAGLTQLEGTNFMGGATYVKENGGKFTGTTPLSGANGTATITETQKDLNFVIPNMYLTRKASKNFAYGIGVFTPFGLGQEYRNSDTSFFRNVLSKIDLQTIVVNPTVAYNVNEVLSVGFGVDFMYGRAKLKRTSVINDSFPPADNQVNLYKLSMDGTGTAWGYNVGLLLKASENVKVGFSYRSAFDLKLEDGAVEVGDISSAPLLFAPGNPPAWAAVKPAGSPGPGAFTTRGVATLNLPATAALGVACKLDKLTVEADADWTFWHSWSRLFIEFDKNNAATGGLFRNIESTSNWRDVVAFRVGAQYQVTPPLALRAGFAYDPTPVPGNTVSALLPDATRLNYMVGAGYKVGSWTIDGSYFFVDKKDRNVSNQGSNLASFPGYSTTGFKGKWTGDAHLVALDIGYKF